MRIHRFFTVLALNVAALLLASGVQALTVDEIIELCNSGYSTGDILEFVETLGIDEPLDAEALARLEEEGCDRELVEELARISDIDEQYESDYDYSSGADNWSRRRTNVYVYAGWGYPYFPYHSAWWCDWSTPWCGTRYVNWDPWYWDSWYWDSYYWHPYHYWAGGHDHGWYRHHEYRQWDHDYRYRYATAHEKAAKSRAQSAYRAEISRIALEKSYRADTESRRGATAYRKSDIAGSAKSTYRVKSGGEDRSSAKAVRKSSSTKSSAGGSTYQKARTGSSRGEADKGLRIRSGTERKTTGISKSGSRSTGSSTYRRSSGTTKSGSTSSTKSPGNGYSKSSSSGSSAASGKSSSSAKSGSSSGERRR